MVANWKIIGACAQGLRHLEEGTACQDKIYSLCENDVAVIALADGAGSAAQSDLGAETAVQALCEKFCQGFDEIINTENLLDAKKIILDFILMRLENKSQELGCDVHELASTLLGAACKGENVLIIHIGDGMIACFKDSRTLLISSPNNGEFVNETFFTTTDNALQKMKLARTKLESIEGFALMSDGADNSFYNRADKKFVDLLKEIHDDCLTYSEQENNPDLQDLMESIIRYNTSDDCGLIIMSRASN